MPEPPLTLVPIGRIRTPFEDRASAPRQPDRDDGARGVIELFPDGRYEHALDDLDTFRFIWVLFWFHLNEGWRPKVRPPRSADRRGVFATRSPYRPNPVGMSVLALERIDGLRLEVRGVDLVDETPILDIKPYIPYADSIPDAGHGWLDASTGEPIRPADPRPAFGVRYSARATEQLGFLSADFGIELAPRIETILSSGPSPHPYRRIRPDADGFILAVQEWRVRFTVLGSEVFVESVFSGYRPRELLSKELELSPHRAYVARFGMNGKELREDLGSGA